MKHWFKPEEIRIYDGNRNTDGINAPVIGIALGVAIFCVATSSILIRYSAAPPLVIAFYRLLFTALLALMLGRLRPITRLYRLDAADRWMLVAAGLAMALHFATWISSLSYTSVASSVLLANLQVVFVAGISYLVLKEKVSLLSLGGILLAFIGSITVGQGDFQGGRLYGDILALLSGLFIALALVVARRVRIRIDLWSYTVAISSVGALVLLIIDLAVGIPLSGYGMREIMLFMLMALLPGIGGHGIFNWALRYVKAPIVSVSILGETIGASLLAWWLFGEQLAGYQLMGGLIVLGGIVIAAAGERGQTTTDKAS